MHGVGDRQMGSPPPPQQEKTLLSMTLLIALSQPWLPEEPSVIGQLDSSNGH